MENEYKFVSKFVEGKTYKELTAEEIEKIKSGTGVKKEDREYIASLEKSTVEAQENKNEETNDEVQEPENTELDKKEEISEEIGEENILSTPNKIIDESPKGVEVIRAVGKMLMLADKRVIELTKAELKEKPFWRKGEIYYG